MLNGASLKILSHLGLDVKNTWPPKSSSFYVRSWCYTTCLCTAGIYLITYNNLFWQLKPKPFEFLQYLEMSHWPLCICTWVRFSGIEKDSQLFQCCSLKFKLPKCEDHPGRFIGDKRRKAWELLAFLKFEKQAISKSISKIPLLAVEFTIEKVHTQSCVSKVYAFLKKSARTRARVQATLFGTIIVMRDFGRYLKGPASLLLPWGWAKQFLGFR